jgi:hypothetical protein
VVEALPLVMVNPSSSETALEVENITTDPLPPPSIVVLAAPCVERTVRLRSVGNVMFSLYVFGPTSTQSPSSAGLLIAACMVANSPGTRIPRYAVMAYVFVAVLSSAVTRISTVFVPMFMVSDEHGQPESTSAQPPPSHRT